MLKEQESRPELADYKLIFKLYKESFDKLITVSKSGYEANCKNFPALRTKMFQVDNPIDATRIIELSVEKDLLWRDCLDHKKINFINIGRYSPEKGLDRLIEAFSRIAKEHENLHLYLVGHGLLYKNLKTQIIALELQEKITLTDNIENPFPLLSACDCFVLSSHYEGQGLVLLESMVLGIPCISTDIPGPRSVLSEGKGLLVDDSVDGLIYGMEIFLKNKVPQEKFNYEEYTENAMSSFYKAIV
jgi:CDP-glycerol glycerophosphotransferase